MFSELTPNQRELFNRVIGKMRFKFPKIPGWPVKQDQFAIMGSSHVILATNGWFVSLFLTPTTTSFEAAICFRKLDRKRGNQIMVEHCRANINEIQKEAEDIFPNRQLILKKAFNAHRCCDYELSIPVMLAQADGIGREIFGFSPYEPGKRNFRKHIEQKVDPLLGKCFRDYFLCVIRELAIKKSTRSDTKPPFPLNRHLVLHGISSDYATEVNALKTVSWLQYIIAFKTQTK